MKSEASVNQCVSTSTGGGDATSSQWMLHKM